MEEALHWINQYGLIAVSLLILSCGVGAPVSQDLIVLIAGFLVGQGVFHFLDVLVVCFSSIIAADFILYHIGKFHELVPFAHKVLTPKRRSVVERFFNKFGSLSILVVAFIPGVRTPTFITAGIVRMKLWKFLSWDFVGMSIVTTLEIYLASRVTLPISKLEKIYNNIALSILGIFLLIVLYLILKYYLKKRAL